tara:strand:+ start:865 stop:1344 length:480 start_codon:yes stop_codon:yes gene_type:complete
MKLKNILISVVLMSFFVNISFSQFNYSPGKNNNIQLTGENYITGEDGVARMSVNIWGHVKYPGTYLVYDSIDLLTCLSMAGGPMKGAKLSRISIVSKDGTSKAINLEDLMKKHHHSISLKPYDTIYIDETMGNYLLARSNVINILLQITNLILISSNNK